MSRGLATCKVCGRDFALIIEDHYVAKDVEKTGVLPALTGQEEAVQYDAFDCPHCGCQNIMQERKRFALPYDFGVCDECNDMEERDGCSECAYEDVSMGEYPCNECKGSYSDMWEKKEDYDE